MKTQWLRGVLLGASLVLLLGGGVALAHMSMTVDQDCFECWPGEWWTFEDLGPLSDITEDHILRVSFTDLEPALTLCWLVGVPPEGNVGVCLTGVPVGEDSHLLSVVGSCEAQQVCIWEGELAGPPPVCSSNAEFGVVSLEAWQEDNEVVLVGPVSGHATYAKVCPEEAEFVPEPQTLVLLGSGLAGLAGYATLRWRARE